MAAMTRLNMVDELKAHGWSRYGDASLQRYLDWALQTTYGEGSFDRSAPDSTTVSATTNDQLTFASIAGASSELLQAVLNVRVKLSGVVTKLTHAGREYFEEVIRPNTAAAQPLTGLPQYYYVYDSNVVLYPKPQVAVDVTIDFLRRKDSFSGDSDTTGVPERFDKIVVGWAEVYCHRRAREVNEMINMERHVRDMMLRELGQEESDSRERYERVVPWGG